MTNATDEHTPEFYRVEEDIPGQGCEHCGHGAYWTVVHGQGDDSTAIGTSWADKEVAEGICELMNDAYEAGMVAGQAPALLALARQYASECGLCDGTGVMHLIGMEAPGPCHDCADIRAIIARATNSEETA